MSTIKVSINNGKKVVETEKGKSLNDILISQNIYLPSACGSRGKCGMCKCVANGTLPSLTQNEQHLLNDNDIARGFRLACQLVPESDCSIEIASEYLGAREYVSELVSKKFLTRDIVELTLKLTDPESITFKSGQYITLKMPAHGDAPPAMRPFSIASSGVDNVIQVNIRLNPQGTVTPWIFNVLKVGMQVLFSGPRGNFFLRNTENPILFIAGGSGMAPVRSILSTMKLYRIKRKAVYFFGALTQSDLFYIDEIRALEKELFDFRFIPALSNEPVESNWSGARGLVTEVIDRYFAGNLKGYEAYLCGKPAMIEGCMAILENKGIKKSDMFFDLFNSPKVPGK
ncbi:MAG TPA: 2Fe-2S iron-sulfur cluster binding domain-containing protein [Chitinispirillaceae bacterium]|nr:2Fe-2S iron-sulfur cluster binding domain-containing protein [Chitinispirillaceae bacterium]